MTPAGAAHPATTDAPRPLALVTGGLHRIGAAIAAALATAGYDLALHSRSGGEPEPALAEAIRAAGCAFASLPQDLAQAGAAAALFEAAVERFGRCPTVLVNNASLFGAGAIADATEAELMAHVAVNLTAPVQLARAMALNTFGDGGTGCVINIIDQRVRNPVPDQFAYTVSKQALWQATRTLAIALAPAIRVNAVAPGLTLATTDYAPGQTERMSQMMPLQLLPEPRDIADAVLYLAHARAVTGQTIFVDGGASMKSFERDFVAL